MATQADVIISALVKCHVLEHGDTYENADQQAAAEAIMANLLALLTELQVSTWGAEDEIPDQAVLPVTTLLAAALCDDFDVPEPHNSRLQRMAWGPDIQDNISAITMLRRLSSNRYVHTPVKSEYF